jgi:hypothetical protein
MVKVPVVPFAHCARPLELTVTRLEGDPAVLHTFQLTDCGVMVSGSVFQWLVAVNWTWEPEAVAGATVMELRVRMGVPQPIAKHDNATVAHAS